MTDVGIPAKSGVAGLVMGVVPGVCGIAVYSPPLDENGNSYRGVEVAKRLSDMFNLHVLKSAKSETSARSSMDAKNRKKARRNHKGSEISSAMSGTSHDFSESFSRPMQMSDGEAANPRFQDNQQQGAVTSLIPALGYPTLFEAGMWLLEPTVL